MNKLSQLHFCGTFRDYQQRVLDNADEYLRDGKIHIVAAPGSGKTILGLELICRLGAPALVLSPSVTIRQQWGERFEQNFLPEGEKIEDCVSYDLMNPKLITSVTYQALHAAYNRLLLENESDGEEETGAAQDFSGFELIKTVKKLGLGTVCLDEAHHLRSEWQKALEGFISAMGTEVTTVALTATPPYDSTVGEWQRYTDLCGEIDDEIFTPQLVKQESLCPHQDYIYFSYPTEAETRVLRDYRERAAKCTAEIMQSGLVVDALKAAGAYETPLDEELFLENSEGFVALLCLANANGDKVPKALKRLLLPFGRLPRFKLSFAETAFQFVKDSPEIFGEELSERLREYLARNSLIEKRKVCLRSNEKLDRQLIASNGKLDSMNEILRAELDCMGDRLRMLVLTDYIKKDVEKLIGTDEPIVSMGTVPVFEKLRREFGDETKLALVSGSLVIIPDSAAEFVRAKADELGISCAAKPIEGTRHLRVSISGSNKSKVALITAALNAGEINVLVGTKALLGEGWDSPCINSLILASFVGSFMLSNQMRGRAIRRDPAVADKTANIWHLVTVEPPLFFENALVKRVADVAAADENVIEGADFKTLQRRFDCFLAPAYNSDVIESGLDRIDVIKPPYTKEGFEEIDRRMLAAAADRAGMAHRWENALEGVDGTEVMTANEVPLSIAPRSVLLNNAFAELLLIVAFYQLLRSLLFGIIASARSIFLFLLSTVMCLIIAFFMVRLGIRIARFFSPKKTVEAFAKCLLHTLRELGKIKSDARIKVTENLTGTQILCALGGATEHEKTEFAAAMSELLSPIDNPRYVLIKKYGKLLTYTCSYPCPSVIGGKKENVEIFGRELGHVAGGFELVYTRSESGRKTLLKCRKKSYLNVNELLTSKKKVSAYKWN